MNKIKYTRQQFQQFAKSSLSKTQLIKKTGGQGGGGGEFRTINKYIKLWNIDISHFTGRAWSRGKIGLKSLTKIPLSSILIQNSNYSSASHLRKRLIKQGLLEQKCCKCGCDGNWMGLKLSLQLDHINGEPTDNRLQNLRILCPNCHAATDTYCKGKGRYNKSITKLYIEDQITDCKFTKFQYQRECYQCKLEFVTDDKNRKFCSTKCYHDSTSFANTGGRPNTRKVKRPSKDVLQEQIKCMPFIKLGEKYGVSDNAIRKWCILYGIEIPKRKNSSNK